MELHSLRYIEFDANEQCVILPNGIKYIEEILKKDSKQQEDVVEISTTSSYQLFKFRLIS